MVVKRIRSFTLIELLIATAIFSVVIVSVYSAFQSGVFGYRNINKAIDTYQSARLIMEQMSKDLMNCFSYSPAIETKFSGASNEVSFLTLVDSYKNDKLGRDYAFVRYNLSDGKLMRLCRTGADALKSASEIAAQEMKAGVTELAFEYIEYDDKAKSLKEPVKEWTDTKKFPAAIKITLAINGEAFTRTVFLPQS